MQVFTAGTQNVVASQKGKDAPFFGVSFAMRIVN
jgi:hypothetical protein